MYSKSMYKDVRIDRELARIELAMSSTGSAVINRCSDDQNRRKAAYRTECGDPRAALTWRW